MIIMSSDYWSCFHSWYVSMIPTRSTQQSSPASPCCCNSRPDGDNQFPEAQKTTRLPGWTSITNRESSKATSVPQQESTNPARPQVSPISAQTSPKTRGQRCRAQPENPARSLQAGVKSLYKFAHEAKRLTHSTYSKRNTCRKSRRVSYRLANKEVSWVSAEKSKSMVSSWSAINWDWWEARPRPLSWCCCPGSLRTPCSRRTPPKRTPRNPVRGNPPGTSRSSRATSPWEQDLQV